MPDKPSLISLLICFVLIYFGALFLWARYFYLRSFSTPERREYFLSRLAAMLFYIPIGLQAVFLFCFALYHLPVTGIKFSNVFDKLVLGNKGLHLPDFYSLQIIFTASVLLAVNYILQRMAAAISDKATAILLQLFVFAGSIFLLRTLVQNIYESIGWNGDKHPFIIYGNTYGWYLSLFISFIFLFTNEEQTRTGNNIKYLSLASRILALYCCTAFLLGLPRIIYLLTELF